MTNLQIKTRISEMLGLARSGADGTEEWAEIQSVVNDAVIDLLTRVRLYSVPITLALTAGVDSYDLGATILQLHNLRKVRSDGTAGDELQEVSQGDVVNAGPGFYAVIGYNRLALGWTPTGSGTELQLKAWQTPTPTPMSGDTDDPSVSTFGGVPVQFHASALVYYGAWKMGEIAGDPGSGLGEKWRIAYEGQDGQGGPGTILGRIKTEINKRSGSGSSQSRRRRSGEQTVADICPAYWQG